MVKKRSIRHWASAVVPVLVIAGTQSIGFGANLLLNGDFSGGNTGFTSSYSFNNIVLNPGTYVVGDKASNHHPSSDAASFGDHTTGTGLMIIANGASTSIPVWQESIVVAPNTQYAFTGWSSSWDLQGDLSPAVLHFTANDVQIGTDATAPSVAGQWAQFSVTWNSGANTSVTLKVTDLNPSFSFNDYVLDDFSFSAVPEPTSLALLATATAALLIRKRRS